MVVLGGFDLKTNRMEAWPFTPINTSFDALQKWNMEEDNRCPKPTQNYLLNLGLGLRLLHRRFNFLEALANS